MMAKKSDRQDERRVASDPYPLKPEFAGLADGIPLSRLLAQRRSRRVRVVGLCDWDVQTDDPPTRSRLR
jgi:hypothetical protein